MRGVAQLLPEAADAQDDARRCCWGGVGTVDVGEVVAGVRPRRDL